MLSWCCVQAERESGALRKRCTARRGFLCVNHIFLDIAASRSIHGPRTTLPSAAGPKMDALQAGIGQGIPPGAASKDSTIKEQTMARPSSPGPEESTVLEGL